jgi:hypothetical protein
MNHQQINELIKENANNGNLATDDISDGYHTFGELYNHRISLFMLLGKIISETKHTSCVWKSKAHSDGSVWDGWFILGIFKEQGKQITYHLPISEWHKCYFAEDLEKAPDWDGHTSDDVIVRINTLLFPTPVSSNK